MRTPTKSIIRWALLFLSCGFLLIGASLLWGAYSLPARDQASTTLEAMYTADQAARQAGIADLGSIMKLAIGDWQRLTKVKRMIEHQMLAHAKDYYHAAMILQHGNASTDYLLAKDMAQQALDRGDRRGIRLRALAEDRYLVSIGQPQRYGSQSHCTAPTGWSLYPVDPTVTDAQRQEAHIPSLEDQRARIATLQRITDGQCALTVEVMQHLETIMESDTSP